VRLEVKKRGKITEAVNSGKGESNGLSSTEMNHSVKERWTLEKCFIAQRELGNRDKVSELMRKGGRDRCPERGETPTSERRGGSGKYYIQPFRKMGGTNIGEGEDRRVLSRTMGKKDLWMSLRGASNERQRS